MRMRDIVLKQAFLGIGFRWEAWHDGDDENHCGCGPTPAEAIADLDRLDQERAEALEDAEHIEEQE